MMHLKRAKKKRAKYAWIFKLSFMGDKVLNGDVIEYPLLSSSETFNLNMAAMNQPETESRDYQLLHSNRLGLSIPILQHK